MENPHHRSRGVAELEFDGAAVDGKTIPIVNDGATHQVRSVLVEPALVKAAQHT